MEALKQFEALVAARIAVIKTACSIILLESRLARLSVFPLLLNICMLLVILLSTWLSLTLLLGYFIFEVSHHLALSIGLVLLFNSVVLVGLLNYLVFNLKNMSFQKTRALFSKSQSDEHEQLKKRDIEANRTDGQNSATTKEQGD